MIRSKSFIFALYVAGLSAAVFGVSALLGAGGHAAAHNSTSGASGALSVAQVSHLHGGSSIYTVTVGAGFTFTPSQLTVNAGDTVVWVNLGGFHTVSSTTGALDSPPGATSYSVTFTQTGVYNYFCEPHQFLPMNGRVTVIDAPGTTATPTDIPSATVTPSPVPTRGPGDPVTTVFTSTKDNTLFSESGAESNGVGDAFYIGKTQADLRRGLVAFDLGAIPPGSVILSATVQLNSLRDNNGPQTAYLHRANAPWGEGGSTSTGGTGAPAQQGDATWSHRFYTSTLWSAPGGDYVATDSTSVTINLSGTVVLPSSPQLVADVQAWVNSPSSNNGWFVIGNEGQTQSAKQIASREHPTAAKRPVLSLTYRPAERACTSLSLTFGPETTSTVTSGTGFGNFVLDATNNKLFYTIVYTGLSSAETNAHFHAFVPPATSGPPIAGQPLTANGSPKTGVWIFGSEAIQDQILNGQVYVNIHSANFPSGEIRGTLLNAAPCRQISLPIVVRQ